MCDVTMTFSWKMNFLKKNIQCLLKFPRRSVHKAGSSHRMALKSRRIALGTVGSRVAKRVLMGTIFPVFESIWAKWWGTVNESGVILARILPKTQQMSMVNE